MRKIIVTTFLTLDGVMQAPGGPEEDPVNQFKYGGWQYHFLDDITNSKMKEIMSAPFDLLLGRRTYDIFAGYWPLHQDNPIGELFQRVNKYVVSTRPLDLSWDKSIQVDKNVAAELQQLKKQDGPDLLVFGSSVLIQTLLAHDLVDVLYTWTHPVTLGTGKRLFEPGIPPKRWKLADTTISGKGVIISQLERDGEVEFGTMGE